MYVQMCIKGVNNISAEDAAAILLRRGLACKWWRDAEHITSAQIAERLTPEELDLHVNSFDEKHPSRGGLVKDQSPFISLTAGTVERHNFLKTNDVHPAHRTALNFARGFGQWEGECYLFYCWVVVGLRPSVEVRHLAEEVRELNTYRRYSAFQTEGEILAKIEVPAQQISKFEKYRISRTRRDRMKIHYLESSYNPDYIDPNSVINFRNVI